MTTSSFVGKTEQFFKTMPEVLFRLGVHHLGGTMLERAACCGPVPQGVMGAGP